MSHIDERIVKMTFDNSSFEKGINQTLQSLEKLNEVLKSTGNTDAVNNLSKSMKDIKGQLSSLNFDELDKLTQKQSIWQKFGSVLSNVGKGIGNLFSKLDIGGSVEKIASSFGKATEGSRGLEKGVESVTNKFSALGIMGATALANVTNGLVNTGKKLVHALTLEPITTGLSEYEMKVNSISTILANTADEGATLDQVTKALDELNAYSDQTIYNFAQMTDNIGKFTAAGVSLDDSVAAIKGMSNLAAYFGVDATKAAGAMYQMSQALAAGKVQLMDWRSLINAGMSGEAFQNALIQTSEVMGTGAKEMIEKYGSFNESLTKGEWLTADVMLETLKQISGAYKESELRAQGYSATQAKAIVDMANRANVAATEVRTITGMLDTMKESVQSGWAISWEHIIGDKEQATELLTNIKNGFDALIKPSTDARNEMLKFWNETGGRNAVIRGFTNIIESMGKGLGAVGEAWKEVFPAMTGQRLVELSNKFRDFTYKIKMNDETAQKIKNTFKGVFDIFNTAKTSIGKLLSGFTPLGTTLKGIGSLALDAASNIGKFASNIATTVNESKLFDSIANGIKKTLEFVNNLFSGVASGIDKMFDSIGNLDFGKVFGAIGKAFSGFGDTLKPVFDGIGKAIGKFDLGALMKTLQAAGSIKALATLKDLFSEVGDVAEEAKGVFTSLKGFGGKVKETLDSAREALEAWQQNLQANALMKIAGAIAILAGALILLASIDTKSMLTSLAGMGVIFMELSAAYGYIAKAGGLKGAFGVTSSLLSMAASMLILAGALKIMSTINLGEMMTGLIGLTAVLGTMMLAVKVFDKEAKNLRETSTSLAIFGASLIIMAGALKILGSINAEELGSGLVAMAGILTELSLFMLAAKHGALDTSTAGSLLILAGAMVVLGAALKSLGSIQWEEMARGLTAMAGGLAIMGIVADVLSETKMIALGAGFAVMSAALLVMSAAIKSLAGIQWEEMARGLTAMAGGLAILGIAADLINGGDMALLGVGIAVMSASLILLSAALQSLAGMSMDEIGRSLVALSGALLVLGVAMFAMQEALLGAAAMVVMAGALAILTPQLLLLGSMDMNSVGIMILALAGAFLVLGAAGLVLSPVIPAIALLAASVALLGVGCLAAGAGCMALGTGLGLIGAAVGGSGLLIVEFIRQLINLLPQMAAKAAEAFAAFVAALGSSVPQLVTGFTAILTALLTAMGTMIPQIAQTGLDIVVALCQGLATAIPQMVTAGMELVLGILEGIAANIGQIVTAAADIIINFMDGIAAKLPSVIESGINLALSFIEGIADGLNNNQARLEAAIRNVITALINAGIAVIRGGISGFQAGGKALLDGLINGIKSMVSAAGSAVKSCIDAAKQAASNLGSALVGAGKSLIEGLVSGIKSAAQSVASAAKSVVEGAINAAKSALKINSPSKVFIEIGKSTDEGFAMGIEKGAGMIDKPIDNVAKRAVNNMSNAISRISDAINGEMDVNPVIAPVMDLSNIQAGARRLGGMLSNGSMEVNGVSGKLAGTIGSIQNGTGNDDVVSALKDLKDSLGSNRPSYTINGITYDDGSNIVNAVETLVRAARIERRI